MSDRSSKETKLFIAQIAGVFLVSLIVLGVTGMLPSALQPDFGGKPSPSASNPYTESFSDFDSDTFADAEDRGIDTETEREERVVTTATKPMSISIPAIDVQSIILHPETPRVDVLDEALQQGAVYYPGSGTIEEGNIFLFGHSTNWAIVQNQAYKTFNGLEDLTAGEEIYLSAGGKTYVYEVESVSHVDANVGFVDLSRPGRRLTISTCDTFGAKSDRWVVDAVFKEVRG
jgi:LPXTG-site transpeptidase (sortase) family protein